MVGSKFLRQTRQKNALGIIFNLSYFSVYGQNLINIINKVTVEFKLTTSIFTVTQLKVMPHSYTQDRNEQVIATSLTKMQGG
jgi:hypothetical protein